MLPLIFFASFIVAMALLVRGIAAIFSSNSRSAIGKHPFVHAALLIFVLAVWFVPWGAPLGAVAAVMDSQSARYRLYSVPIRDRIGVRIAYSRILKDRYDISSSPMRGCLVFSMNDVAYERAYDAVMIPAIKQHFGRDILAECEDAAGHEGSGTR